MKQHTVKILYEDNHLIAVNKPIGWLSQGDETGDWTLMDEVKKYIKKKYDKPGDVFLGSFQRLDRPTSGVIFFAKTSKALTRMNTLIRERKITKRYLAVVDGRPNIENKRLVHYLSKDKKTNKSKAYDKAGKKRKEAILNLEVLAYLNQVSLLDIDLNTGRSHQIRVQLSKTGTPIVGDMKYGAMRKTPNLGIALHCLEIGFIHPVKQIPISVKAKFPDFYPWDNFKDFKTV